MLCPRRTPHAAARAPRGEPSPRLAGGLDPAGMPSLRPQPPGLGRRAAQRQRRFAGRFAAPPPASCRKARKKPSACASAVRLPHLSLSLGFRTLQPVSYGGFFHVPPPPGPPNSPKSISCRKAVLTRSATFFAVSERRAEHGSGGGGIFGQGRSVLYVGCGDLRMPFQEPGPHVLGCDSCVFRMREGEDFLLGTLKNAEALTQASLSASQESERPNGAATAPCDPCDLEGAHEDLGRNKASRQLQHTSCLVNIAVCKPSCGRL